MGLVKISHLKPAMVVRSDVKDCNGRLLVAAGTTLSANHIRIMKIWGIVEADSEDASQRGAVSPPRDAIDPTIVKAAEEALRGRFRYNDLGNSVVAELFRLGSLRKAMQMTHGKPEDDPPRPSPGRRPRNREGGRDNRRREPGAKGLDHIRELIGKDIRLTTLPTVFTRINETIMKPSSSSREIADLISRDTALSARLLKIVNSAFYGYPSRIDSLSQAVSIVGTNQLSMIALGIDVVAEFNDIPKKYINMDLFWRHSIASGVIARLIAATRNIQNTERLFVAGMLHDVGRLVLYHYLPHEALDILERACETGAPLCRMEAEYLGGDHAEIGGLLLRVWKLPQSLETAVRYHHQPGQSPNGLEPAIVHVADITAKALGIGSSGDYSLPPLDPVAWKQVGLPDNALDPIMAQAERQLGETFHLFFQ